MRLDLSVNIENPFKRFFSTKDVNEDKTPQGVHEFDSMSLFRGFSNMSLDNAMKFTAVFAAIRLRSETVASLPKEVKVETDIGRVAATNHEVYKLLKYKPNGYMNIFSFWEYLNACLDGWGNAYVLIIRSRGGIAGELIPLHPSFVDVTFSSRKKWYRVSGSKCFDGIYSDDDILHFFSLSMDGIKGVNPITYNAAAIQTGISATAFGNEFFEKGGNLKGVFETEKELKGDSYKNMIEHLHSYGNYETPILENGLKYKAIGIAPEAAQMLQTRAFALQDIARIFNVPPHMIAELSRSTFNNIEHQDIQYVKYSIRPTIKRYETEMESKLFFSNELGRYSIKFNLDGLLRGDMKSRAEYYRTAIQNGFLSRNEVREMENRNKVEGLDDYLYPSNMNILGKEINKKGKTK